MIKIDFTTKTNMATEYTVDDRGNKFTCDPEGEFHSYNDLPAVIYFNGTKVWYKHGKCHRDNEMPSVIWASGKKLWYDDGKFIKTSLA